MLSDKCHTNCLTDILLYVSPLLGHRHVIALTDLLVNDRNNGKHPLHCPDKALFYKARGSAALNKEAHV